MKFMTWNIQDGGILNFNFPIINNIENILNTIIKEHPDKTLRKRVLIATNRILGIHVPLATTTNIYNIKKDNKREKKIFLDALKSKFVEYKKSNEPCIICGDFNLHSNAIYKVYLEEFANHLTEVTTTEITHEKYKFDYIFVNEAFRNLMNTNEIFVPHPTKFSDHSYLCVKIA